MLQVKCVNLIKVENKAGACGLNKRKIKVEKS